MSFGFDTNLYRFIYVCRYGYGEPIPYRFSNDAYVARLLVPLRSVGDHIKNISFYNEPAKKFTGKYWNRHKTLIAKRNLELFVPSYTNTTQTQLHTKH